MSRVRVEGALKNRGAGQEGKGERERQAWGPEKEAWSIMSGKNGRLDAEFGEDERVWRWQSEVDLDGRKWENRGSQGRATTTPHTVRMNEGVVSSPRRPGRPSSSTLHREQTGIESDRFMVWPSDTQ